METKKTSTLKAIGGAAILGLAGLVGFSACNPKQEELVRVPVQSTMLWDVWTAKDSDGDSLINKKKHNWNDTLFAAYKANEVKNADELSKTIRQNGYVMLPQSYVNPQFDGYNQ